MHIQCIRTTPVTLPAVHDGLGIGTPIIACVDPQPSFPD